MTDSDIRIPVLKRLAEQAMSDAAFRAAARQDLDAALVQFGYDLNGAELPLVHSFRDALAEAGVDLSLVKELAIDLDDEFSIEDLDRIQHALRDGSGQPDS